MNSHLNASKGIWEVAKLRTPGSRRIAPSCGRSVASATRRVTHVTITPLDRFTDGCMIGVSTGTRNPPGGTLPSFPLTLPSCLSRGVALYLERHLAINTFVAPLLPPAGCRLVVRPYLI